MCAWATVSQFLPHNSAILQFQILMMDGEFKKEQIGTLFCLVGALDGGFGVWVTFQKQTTSWVTRTKFRIVQFLPGAASSSSGLPLLAPSLRERPSTMRSTSSCSPCPSVCSLSPPALPAHLPAALPHHRSPETDLACHAAVTLTRTAWKLGPRFPHLALHTRLAGVQLRA